MYSTPQLRTLKKDIAMDKKVYTSPLASVIRIETVNMIAESAGTNVSSEGVSGSKQLSRDNSDFWDDEE